MKISVLVPTYARPQDLARCLAALADQIRPPDEIILTVRDSDEATWVLLRSLPQHQLPLRIVTAPPTGGVVAAMNAGLAALHGDVVAITDDDAAPHRDWLYRIERHFSSTPLLGGVGGRDRCFRNGTLLEGQARQIGKIEWFGRIIGNHHLEFDRVQRVDNLKGVNGANAVALLRPLGFDARLLGKGAQVHWEISLGLTLKRMGYTLLYDPAIVVDHYESKRIDEERVWYFNTDHQAVLNASYNEALILLDHNTPLQRVGYLLWSFWIGASPAPGLVQAIRFTPQAGWRSWQRFAATQRGKVQALRTFLAAKDRVALSE